MTMLAPGSFREADRLYDQRDLAGVQLWDSQAMVYAYEAAADGRHYDALPAVWREFARSYRQGVWRYQRQAARRMAVEFLQIGWAYSAEYHAVIAQDVKVAERIGEHLLAWRQPQHVERMVRSLIANSNLKRHAWVACVLLVRIADAIPDIQVDAVLRWLLRSCAIVPVGQAALRTVSASWNAVQSLALRLNVEQSRNIVRTAMEHPSWGQDDHLREHIVRAVNFCVASLPPEDIPELAQQSLALITWQQDDINMDDDVISLLRHLAALGDDKVKTLIGNALYRGNKAHVGLLLIAQEFGRGLENGQEANRLAEFFANDVRLQVQSLSPEEEFKMPAISLGSITAVNESGRFGVSNYIYDGLMAVIANRQLLEAESIRLLVQAILAMIREPQNTLSNKAGLINGIIALSDSVTPELSEEIFETLAPAAAGEVVGLDATKATGDPDHPLNRFKVRLGDPATVQGGALYALACVEANRTGVYGQRLIELLDRGVVSPDAVVRRFAFTALHGLPTLPDSTLTNVLLGTRDNDSSVSEEAFLTLGSHLRDSGDFLNPLVYSLTVACQSSQVNLRRAAAYTIKLLRERQLDEQLSNKLQMLESELRSDICYSVRSEISGEGYV